MDLSYQEILDKQLENSKTLLVDAGLKVDQSSKMLVRVRDEVDLFSCASTSLYDLILRGFDFDTHSCRVLYCILRLYTAYFDYISYFDGRWNVVKLIVCVD